MLFRLSLVNNNIYFLYQLQMDEHIFYLLLTITHAFGLAVVSGGGGGTNSFVCTFPKI